MKTNQYKLGTKNTALNEKADFLVKNITFLANERVFNKRFPAFSSINYSELDEEELIMHIEDLEKIYNVARKETDFGLLHHRSHPYILLDENGWFHVYHNDTEYGTDPITTSPIAGGATALQALCNAWKVWSIPSVLIQNSKHYCPGANINKILAEVEQ